MKQYATLKYTLWLALIWLLALPIATKAQSAPPQIQWQRVLEDTVLSPLAVVRAVRLTAGGYGVLAGNNVSLLTDTGDLIWTKPVPGSYADSSANRVAANQTLAITASPDGGLAILARDSLSRYYVTKVSAQGSFIWAKTVGRAEETPAVRLTDDMLSVAPDGSYLVAGLFADKLAYLTLTKLSSEGYIVGQWRVRFTGSTRGSRPTINQVLPLPNRGFLLVGQAIDSMTNVRKGIAFQLDAAYSVVWQQQYTTLSTIQDVALNSDRSTYTALGSINENAQAITIAPNRPNDGKILVSLPGRSKGVGITANDDGTLTVLDAVDTSNGDFRLSNGLLPAPYTWMKRIGGSAADIPTALLATDDGGYLALGTTRSTDGSVVGKTTNTLAAWVLRLGAAAPTDSLQLTAPTYNCQTGAITFRTTGGDGSPIQYAAEGVTNWTTEPNQTVDARYRTADDAPPLLLMAMQGGHAVFYTFNQKAACGRARVGTGDLSVSLLGNPVRETAQVTIVGAQGRPIQLVLFDSRGGLVEQRTIDQSQATEKQLFDLRQQAAGTLVLKATVNGQVHTLRVLKQ